MWRRIGTLLIVSLFAFGQDVSVIISEKTVNDFIGEVGPVTGKGKSKGIGYKWKVKSAKFDFEPGSATFQAEVDLDAGVFKLSDKVSSQVQVAYDAKSNKITMKVEEAIFKIYIKVLGKKTKVGEVDIAKYYKPKFEFNGPQPIQNVIEMDVGKDKPRQIFVSMAGNELLVEKDQIRVSSILKYKGQNKE